MPYTDRISPSVKLFIGVVTYGSFKVWFMMHFLLLVLLLLEAFANWWINCERKLNKMYIMGV
jgi:hypothetical protein